jgi:hypothetical protein
MRDVPVMNSKMLTVVFGISICGLAEAQVKADGPLTPSGCVRLTDHGIVRATGRLSVRTFPGPPGYESVAHGDLAERVYLMKLPEPICIDDGDAGFADPTVRFETAQVSVSDDALWPKLRDRIGRVVTVSGEAFAAFDGHHHAPMVIMANRIQVSNTR